MQFLALLNPLYSISGLCVGMLVGITGVGGGSLMTPLLVLLFGIHPAMAVGTDLLYAAITKTAGTAVHRKHQTINWKIVCYLAAGSVPAALLTLYMIHGVDRKSISVISYLSMALGWMLLLTAFLLLFRKSILQAVETYRRHHSPVKRSTVQGLTFVLGIVLGTLVTLTSVGAGALGVTVLLAFYPRLDVREIVGSDIAHAVPLTLVGGIGYWAIGEINWALLVSLLIGSIPGIVIGSNLAPRMAEQLIRRILAVTLCLVSIKLIVP